MKILVVEDEAVSRRVLEIVLTKLGYTVLAVSNAKDALTIMNEPDSPDLLILDWMMPEMNGLDLCKEIRIMPNAQSKFIIFLTAKSTDADMAHALNEGANAYINKPFEKTIFLSLLEEGKNYVTSQQNILKSNSN